MSSQRRLNVNINKHTEAALLEVSADMGVSITEALRVLTGFGHFAWRSQQDGYKLSRKRNGQAERFDLRP